MLAGAKTGAATAAGLLLLLGTRGGRLLALGAGRLLAGRVLSAGGLAALGGMAYAALRDARSGSPPPPEGATDLPAGELEGEAAEARSRALLRAMIAAARVTGEPEGAGVPDEAERSRLVERLRAAGIVDEATERAAAEADAFVEREAARPLDITAVAAAADSPAAAREIYLVSAMVADPDNPAEREYLDRLARALQLDPALAARLEASLAED